MEEQNNKKQTIKKIIKLVGKAVSILSILFVIRAIYKLGFDFSNIDNWPIFILVVIICVLIKTGTVFLSGSAWYGWLALFTGKKDKHKEAVAVYAKANIGKYLPGNVMHYVERNLFAGKLGMSQKKLAAASVLEVLTLVSVAFIMAVVVSASQLKIALHKVGESYKAMIALVIALGILFVAVVFFVFRKKIKQFLEDVSPKELLLTVLRNMFLDGMVLFLLGSVMVVLYCYMGGTFELQTAAKIISGYVIAWVLGFVVPGAPGGVGVREIVILLLLESVIGGGLVTTLSITHRLITIIGDFLAYVLRLALVPAKQKE
ncbi:MAG: flippase-like domain-containing protein [Eubacterium sp.]|nr:flippase-like domain-containing protein [Eubacterium sp.]